MTSEQLATSAMKAAIDQRNREELKRLSKLYLSQWQALCMVGYRGLNPSEMELLVQEVGKWPKGPKPQRQAKSTEEQPLLFGGT